MSKSISKMNKAELYALAKEQKNEIMTLKLFINTSDERNGELLEKNIRLEKEKEENEELKSSSINTLCPICGNEHCDNDDILKYCGECIKDFPIKQTTKEYITKLEKQKTKLIQYTLRAAPRSPRSATRLWADLQLWN